MAKKPETRIQMAIQKRIAKEFGGWFFKVHGGPYQQAGVPDLVGCIEGLFFAFEVKTDDGSLSPLQIETLKRIRERGGAVAAEVRSPDEAVEIINDTLAQARRSPKNRRTVRSKS